MTIADHLEERGRRKGFRQGRKEGHDAGHKAGHKEGQKAEALRIARQMLSRGIEKALVLQITGLSETELAHISH